MKRGERKELAKTSWRWTAQIYGCVSAKEVSDGWHKARSTVNAAIHSGRLVARKTSGTWFISYRSVVALWGKPLEREIIHNED